MKKTGFLYDKRYLKHLTGAYHPEIPERLTAIVKGITEADFFSSIINIEAKPADSEAIETVHTKEYIKRFHNACLNHESIFDCPDNQICSDSYDIALLSVGGVLTAADMIMEGKLNNAFCAIRPPGHHAETDQGMGFCYFNNVAIAARHLQRKWNIKRVGIIDIDVHHGNGTEHIFEKNPSVFYYSIHEHPSFAYPGTGRDFDIGKDEGTGFTKNSPVLPGRGIEEYTKLFTQDCIPAFEKFKPEVIIISTGFDAHEDDEMSRIQLSTQGFSWLAEQITNLANNYCQSRLLSVLEGGYCIKRLPELARNHIKILLNS